MNIGVLGGTFDPIHLGHLRVASEVISRLGLDLVLFVPAGKPWLKEIRFVSPPEHRMEMIRLAISSTPYFKLSIVDIQRTGRTYSVDTVADIRKEYGEDSEYFFIIGWDIVDELLIWKEPARLVKMCRLVAVTRPGFTRPNPTSLEGAIPEVSKRIIVLDIPPSDISASDIRRRVAQGLSIRFLVPEPVEQYIRKQRLYL